MTSLLEKAFEEASRLSPPEQDLLATRLLAELAAEDDFDRKLAATPDALRRLAQEALSEYDSGHTEELDPERL